MKIKKNGNLENIIQFNEILLFGLNLTIYIKIINIPPKINKVIINDTKENWQKK